MASTAFLIACCVRNDSVAIDSDIPSTKTDFEIGVISVITLTIAVFSFLGTVIIIYPYNSTSLGWYSRYLLQSSEVIAVTKNLVVAEILANLGKCSIILRKTQLCYMFR